MQRVHEAIAGDRPLCRNQRLADHLSAEHSLPSRVGAGPAAKQVLLQLFEVEYCQQCADGIDRGIRTRH